MHREFAFVDRYQATFYPLCRCARSYWIFKDFYRRSRLCFSQSSVTCAKLVHPRIDQSLC